MGSLFIPKNNVLLDVTIDMEDEEDKGDEENRVPVCETYIKIIIINLINTEQNPR